MAVLDLSPPRPLLRHRLQRGEPLRRAQELAFVPAPALQPFADELLRPRTSRFRSLALILAMLASAGAGVSLTLTVMDYKAEAPAVTIAPPQEKASQAAASATKDTAIPHDVWAPFATRVPTLNLRPPAQTRPPVERTAPATTGSLGPSNVMPVSSTSGIHSWRYQLQGVDPAAVARAPDNDLMVVDYAGSRGPFSRADVERMRGKPDGSRRRVISYLSIGEAEDYRFYWKSEWSKHPPAWLGRENARWKKNYAVHFWDPQWQAIMLDYLDRIIAAGFDGIYLDRVDMFEQLGHADEMVDFVARLSQRAKAAHPGFMVISQNGDALLPKKRFRDAIDGFAREDLLYGEERDGERNKPDSIRDSIRRLKLIAADNKPVFVVEYPRTGAQAETARREIAQEGFIGLIAPRQLDRL